MIHFSTLPSGLFPAEDTPSQTTLFLSEEDELFLAVVRKKLNQELKEPSPETVLNILAYSKGSYK